MCESVSPCSLFEVKYLPLDAGTKDLPNVEPAGSRRKEQTERTEAGARPEESRAFQGAGTGVRGRTGESAAGASTPQREHPPGSQPRQNNLAPLRSRAQLVPVARLEPDAEKQEGFDTGTRRADPSHTPPPVSWGPDPHGERSCFVFTLSPRKTPGVKPHLRSSLTQTERKGDP